MSLSATVQPASPVPSRLYLERDQVTADWVDIAGTDPALPFLSDRIAAAEAKGRTAWQAPLPEAGEHPASAPAGLILHAGRCGSTLVSRSLSLLPGCHVLSEPQALNDALAPAGAWAFARVAVRRRAVEQVVAALGRAAPGERDRFILKLSSWNALHLPLLEAAFPAAPLVFVYREPEEILVSLRDAPPMWLRWAADPVRAGLFLGVAPSRAPRSPLAFAAQVVGRVLAEVAASVGRNPPGRWLLVPYGALPGAIAGQVAPHLRVPLGGDAEARLALAAGRHAKDPTGTRPFSPDGARKRAAVTEEVADLARDWIRDPFERLESLRGRADGVAW